MLLCDTFTLSPLQQILEQRQLKEFATLDTEFHNEKQTKVEEALSHVKAQHENDKEKLMSKHAVEIQELESSCKDENEFDNKRAELLDSQHMELFNLEETFLKECSQVEASVTAELEAKHANAKITTQERHYQVSPTGI